MMQQVRGQELSSPGKWLIMRWSFDAIAACADKEIIMPTFVKSTRATVIPVLRYRDAPAAIEWLCRTLGFEKHLIVPNEDGTIAHAELSFGNGMIMLGSVLEDETEFGRLMKQPDEIGGAETQSPYVVVDDVDAVYARAKAVGAKIAVEIRDEAYGGRDFSCYDLEGHLWSFGTYDPWGRQPRDAMDGARSSIG
jgi:uncharacterized glyoxalase superfamily protein PhnB